MKEEQITERRKTIITFLCSKTLKKMKEKQIDRKTSKTIITLSTSILKKKTKKNEREQITVKMEAKGKDKMMIS